MKNMKRRIGLGAWLIGLWTIAGNASAVAVPVEPPSCVKTMIELPQSLSSELACRVEWLKDAREYLRKGGTPTQATNQTAFAKTKQRAQEIAANLSKWLVEVNANSGSTPYEDANRKSLDPEMKEKIIKILKETSDNMKRKH